MKPLIKKFKGRWYALNNGDRTLYEKAEQWCFSRNMKEGN